MKSTSYSMPYSEHIISSICSLPLYGVDITRSSAFVCVLDSLNSVGLTILGSETIFSICVAYLLFDHEDETDNEVGHDGGQVCHRHVVVLLFVVVHVGSVKVLPYEHGRQLHPTLQHIHNQQ